MAEDHKNLNVLIITVRYFNKFYLDAIDIHLKTI